MGTRAEALARLSPAERARTIIAAGTHVGWPIDGETVMAPYLDADGRPVLMVDPETSGRLLCVGAVDMQMGASRNLGTVVLGGWLQPIAAAQLSGP
ncbi:MAG: hypothetical protein ABW075_10605, partial [Aeromicrobium sp.]